VINFPRYTCYTLFDIPSSGTRSTIRNWNTLIQMLSLKTQPFIIDFPTFEVTDLSKYKFGKVYKGKQKVWSFTFEVEHPDLFVGNGNPIEKLLEDTDLIPMLDYNNIIVPPCCLRSRGDTCNIYYAYNIIDIINNP